jgi:hypothetical protein
MLESSSATSSRSVQEKVAGLRQSSVEVGSGGFQLHEAILTGNNRFVTEAFSETFQFRGWLRKLFSYTTTSKLPE